MSDLLPKEKYNQKVYVFQEDWETINRYFALTKGRSPLSKTRAIREVIHSWVVTVIRPQLQLLEEQENRRAKGSPSLDIEL